MINIKYNQMRISLLVLIIGTMVFSVNVLLPNDKLAFAFINNELANSPGIFVVEDCYNHIDDDKDGLIDFQDTLDCFNSPSTSPP